MHAGNAERSEGGLKSGERKKNCGSWSLPHAKFYCHAPSRSREMVILEAIPSFSSYISILKFQV